MTPQEILKRPIITERATVASERLNQVTFEVAVKANKHQIRDALEFVYPDIKVTKVRTMVVPGKLRRLLNNRPLLRAFGWLNVGLGFIGVLLPLMPTTVFLLIALWAFPKARPSCKSGSTTTRVSARRYAIGATTGPYPGRPKSPPPSRSRYPSSCWPKAACCRRRR